jgi:hypothetical protein
VWQNAFEQKLALWCGGFTLILRPQGSILRAGGGIWNSIFSGLAHIVSLKNSNIFINSHSEF